MTTITPILTGVATHIGTYADAVAVSGGGTEISCPEHPGCAKTAPRRRTSPTKPASAGPASKARSAGSAPSLPKLCRRGQYNHRGSGWMRRSNQSSASVKGSS